MHGSDPSSVCAVLVAYRADPAVLLDALNAVRPQVGTVLVVNNGPDVPELPPGCVLLQQDGNVGLAAGQNAGIAWARAHGFAHVLILDQDSVCGPEMVSTLLAALAELGATERVGAVGPVFRDPREDRAAPFVRVAFPMSHKVWCDGSSPYVQCDFLISSGALVPLAVLDDVGGLDDGLFIDNVDMEWSFRVRSRGYTLFGVCAATMTHHLGDDRHPVLAGRAQVVRHGPVRLYFIMRNRVALYRLPHTPRVWIAQDVPRVFAKFFIFSVLVGPRPRNVRFMLRGLLDGLRGRRGPCPLGPA